MVRAPLAARLAGLATLALLAGCPEERPGAEKQIPTQRVPPAMSVEPPPSGAALPSDAGPAIPGPAAPRRP